MGRPGQKKRKKHTGRTASGSTRDVKIQRIGRVTVYRRGTSYYLYYREAKKSVRRKVDGNLATARATAAKVSASLEEGCGGSATFRNLKCPYHTKMSAVQGVRFSVADFWGVRIVRARGPRGWKKRVKRVLLNVISLGRVCGLALEAEDDALEPRENELLRQELRLKDARMARVPARRRPHYSPVERMEIMELKAARGWEAGLILLFRDAIVFRSAPTSVPREARGDGL